MKRLRIGPRYVMAVPFVAAIASVEHPRLVFLHFTYTGWIWVTMFAVGLVLVANNASRITLPVLTWAPWVTYVFLSIFWIRQPGVKNLQTAMQITMPVLVGAVASIYIREEGQLQSLRRAFYYALPLLIVISVFCELNPADRFKLMPRTAAMSASFIACVFVGSIAVSRFWGAIGWGACLGLAVLSQSRMATFVILLIWILRPRLGAAAKLIIVVAMLALGLALFHTPIIQDRFFGPGGGSVGDLLSGNFSGTGRFESWPLIWTEAKRNFVQGSGIGESGGVVREIWRGVANPHNDYLRIMLELGAVGLTCFLFAVGSQLYDVRQRLRGATGEVEYAFTACYLGLLALLIFAFTSNPIEYNVWLMNPMFAVLGSAYGVAAAQPRTVRRPAVRYPPAGQVARP